MNHGKERWIVWVSRNDLQKLRSFWTDLSRRAKAPKPKLRLNTVQTRSQLIKFLRDRPDDWKFGWPEKTNEEAHVETRKPLYKRIDWVAVFVSFLFLTIILVIVLGILAVTGLLNINVRARPVSTVATLASIPTESASTTSLQPSPTVIVSETLIVTETMKFTSGWETDWYWSPFRDTTDRLDDETTKETFAEPGVLLDNTAAFDYLSAEETPINAPEGGFAYIAVGHISLSHDGYGLSLPGQTNNIYLIIIRGLPDDGTDADFNQQVWASDYPRGFGIYSPMPYGAYVSLGWFLQQVENAQESSGDPNCGADGCDKVTVVVIELQSHSYRLWEVLGDSRDWTRVQ